VIDVSFLLVILIYLLVCVIYLLILICPWVIVSNTLNGKEIMKVNLIEQKLYPNHKDPTRYVSEVAF
jgi:hypothetical protein